MFFSKLSERLDLTTLQGGGYLLTIYAIIILVIALFLFVFGQKYLLKPLAIILLLLSAVLSYFTYDIGVVFDIDMVRNIVGTIKDNNQQEATELFSFPLFLHVFLYGVLPSVFVFWVSVSYKRVFKELASRILYFLGLGVIVVGLIMINFKYTTYFSRENRDLRVYITPLYAIDSTKGYFKGEQRKKKQPLKIIGEDAVQKKRSKQRTIGIMVVGETSRAVNYSLNGYSRETNPKLKKEKILYYKNTASCGTSTAYSVPCMFALLDRKDYSPVKASLQSNSLDILEKAGVEVLWIDNNSSCKGVCERTGELNIRQHPDTKSPFYSDGEEFDEALINKMDELLKTEVKNNKDILVVLHTLGSHGPKYYKRYPAEFSVFEPACKKSSPQECSDQEIINAYDNTILYTDHVLSQLINYLKNTQSESDTFLVYASDHGESLGENGLYLHGLPYFLAPKEQTHVPMLTWFSEKYIENQKLDMSAMSKLQEKKVSHDNLSHTLLSAFDVTTKVYKSDHDLLVK
jgi:lipid A ethanolaminephosphotransferase